MRGGEGRWAVLAWGSVPNGAGRLQDGPDERDGGALAERGGALRAAKTGAACIL
jgi:hypothetical protein